MPNPTQVNWTDPTANVDGSPIAAGEITGYTVGVRSTTAAGSAAGTYPYSVTAPATSTSELLAAITPILPPDSYAAAVQANTAGPSSAWSAEASFAIAAPAPTPNPPPGSLSPDLQDQAVAAPPVLHLQAVRMPVKMWVQTSFGLYPLRGGYRVRTASGRGVRYRDNRRRR